MSNTEIRIANATSKKELNKIIDEVMNFTGFINSHANKFKRRVDAAYAKRDAQLSSRKRKKVLTAA